jgi:hypothetical protein
MLTPAHPHKARGTCKNWFYKIASIRELLPRLYVEMAILRSIRFIQKGTFPTVINRVAGQIRGVGDPLVALYARSYLARKGHEVAPLELDYLKTVFADHLVNQTVIHSRPFKRRFARKKETQMLDWSDYLDLYSPGLDWVLQCIGSNAKVSVANFEWVLDQYDQSGKNPFVLKHIISSFNPKLIAENGRKIVKLIGASDGAVFPKYQLYTSLGVVFSMAPPPRAHVVGILNDIWSVITKMKDIREYLSVAEVFVEFPLRYLGANETDILLGDVVAHVSPVREAALASGLPSKRRRRSKKSRSKRSKGSHDSEQQPDPEQEKKPEDEDAKKPQEEAKTKKPEEGTADADAKEKRRKKREEKRAAREEARLDSTAVEDLYEDIQDPLQSLIEKILQASPSVADAFALENLVPLLDCFAGEAQIDTYKSILKEFGREEASEEKKQRLLQQKRDTGVGLRETEAESEKTEGDGNPGEEAVDVLSTTNNPQLVHAMFMIGKAVHDSVNTLTFADEKRQISAALCAFVHKIDYGRNFEKQLDFFAECRRAFGGLDPVKEVLVLGACDLAVRTLQLVRGAHNNRTTAFVRAALAFCYITVPSMESVQTRLKLYLHCAECALLNQAISQADGMLRAAVKLVQEVPHAVETIAGKRPTLSWTVDFVGNLCGLLAMTPGHPEQGAFYLVKGLLQVLMSYDWKNVHADRARAFLKVLPLLTGAYAQRRLPYSVARVDANDVLYNLDADYVSELDAITAKVLDTILEDVAALGNAGGEEEGAAAENNFLDQALLSLDVMNQVIAFCDLNPKSATFCVHLFDIVKKHLVRQEDAGITDQRLANYAKQTVRAVDRKGDVFPLARELHKKLVA